MNANEQNHAEQNASGWTDSIVAMVSAMEADYDRLQELRDERTDILDRIEEAQREEVKHDEQEAQFDLQQWDNENGEELRELSEAVKIDGDECTDADAARERIMEAPLSVQVRSGWGNPGDPMQAEEFEILLSTGGPALRIRGELDEHQEPTRAWLEYQDWGTPWTQYFKVEQDTLLAFARCFYFGS